MPRVRRALSYPWRLMWARENWSAFRLGYITALDDVDHTGLRPNREDTKEEAAERAFRRYTGL